MLERRVVFGHETRGAWDESGFVNLVEDHGSVIVALDVVALVGRRGDVNSECGLHGGWFGYLVKNGATWPSQASGKSDAHAGGVDMIPSIALR